MESVDVGNGTGTGRAVGRFRAATCLDQYWVVAFTVCLTS